MLGFRYALLIAALWSLSFTVMTDGRSILDPLGNPVEATTNGDHHCTIDPNGEPCTTGLVLGDSSSQIDPNG